MNCPLCSRRHFLKLCAATAGSLGFFHKEIIPNSFAGKLPTIKINMTARCLFAGVVATAENQKMLPNPYHKDMDYAFVMNRDCSGIDQGVDAVRSGAADIGTVFRALTDEEKAEGLAETKLDDLAYTVVVNKKNPVGELTAEQVVRMFAGQIRNWKEVGGKDLDILIYRQKCGANYDGIIDQAIATAGIRKNQDRLKKAVMTVEITDNQFEKIAALDMAVTLAPRSFFDAKTKAVKIDGELPTRDSEKHGRYPFVAPLSLVSRQDASNVVQDYVSFMSGPRGGKLIENGLNMDWLRNGF